MNILKSNIQLQDFIIKAKDGDTFYFCDQKYQVIGKENWVLNNGNITKHVALYSINCLLHNNIVVKLETKIAVCGILQFGNRIVSVKRKDQEAFGLIGGKVEQFEAIFETLIRETKEETGFDVEINYTKESFSQEDSEGYLVYCYLMKLKPNSTHGEIAKGEQPFLYLLTKEDLIKYSPFGEYNKRVFEYFNI